ncbi:Allergen V5/Tpx-1 related protein (modular protein) (plasmid) [Cupriavidus taiwanensis]|uniref:Allergen V5/Tpx-1 related protein (Modular protein) n=1 Tax=Cupriavidus taiwanensis TaxID=164546 RepID=A0A375I864_9BURK|nr:Allergen V5/Tpx-1 related protein (modular protein) [Cupriavidus taiwanensis]SOZ85370.1 Allergen V5/Tpx-1 related protein (modular protein) [Cupriavidus taiwanensis]SPA53900.1 Allergen V5/Tpx-1 related protein (modular protein) [Cupriavidus taiwanensis]SPK70011.1 Allergen V5/Tpx-1 related protein (modular protein) [Cupriavidus taiwanensis]SPK74813.1 Allergen V5/Tpx-1 related protein (modular protein) [Cupriavidus taiwanensis]
MNTPCAGRRGELAPVVWRPAWLAFASVLTLTVLASPLFAQPLAGANTCGALIHTPPSQMDAATRIAAGREAVRCLINAERTSRNLGALSANSRLTSAAQGHADAAASLKWWTGGANPHVNPQTGSTIDSRISATGYCGGKQRLIGEIAYTGRGAGAPSEGCPLGECATPAAAVNWWMNISKSGHREQILTSAYNELGTALAGVAATPDGALPEMGTYVVDFGACDAPEPAPPASGTSPPPPPPPNFQRTAVRFQNMHVNDCPEIGVCDWKLTCHIGNQPDVELLGMVSRNTGEDVPLSTTMTQDGAPPMLVTCTVKERDGPFLFFDSAVWELVGTVSTPFDKGQRDLRINQNRGEGDVTVQILVESLGATHSGTSPPPLPPPPAAPTGCRIPEASFPRCGFLSAQCDAPLPAASEYLIAGVVGQVFRSVPEIGLVDAEYREEGDRTLKVCARNAGGTRCSNGFGASLGPLVCPHPPAHRICPEGQRPCPLKGCIANNQHCDFLQ